MLATLHRSRLLDKLTNSRTLVLSCTFKNHKLIIPSCSASVIPAAGKYGLCLNEILFAEYLNELNYSSHIVGKVSYHPCRPALLAWCIFLFLPTFFHIFSLRNISLLIITARKRSLGQGNVFSSVLSGYHADTPITIKAEPFIWPTAAFINIHEHPL